MAVFSCMASLYPGMRQGPSCRPLRGPATVGQLEPVTAWPCGETSDRDKSKLTFRNRIVKGRWQRRCGDSLAPDLSLCRYRKRPELEPEETHKLNSCQVDASLSSWRQGQLPLPSASEMQSRVVQCQVHLDLSSDCQFLAV